nr:two-component regulator propeller domain-containing protein [uncultured Carboxylicivirga sp.]
MLNQILKSYILVILIVSSTFEISAENNRFVHLTDRDGLPHQQIEALFQDHNGYLWIGTKCGLCKYDGYSFMSFFNEQNDSTSLMHNFIKAIYEDHKHRLWIGHSIGISRYIPETNSFKNYNLNKSLIHTIKRTSEGEIFASGAFLFKYNESKDEFEQIKDNANTLYYSMAINADDEIFLTTSNGIVNYNDETNAYTYLNPTIYKDFLNVSDRNIITPMFFDSHQNLWISRNHKGIQRVKLKTQEIKIWDEHTISDGVVRVISEDNKGNIWLGTEKGITIINTQEQVEIIQQDFSNNNTLNDNPIYSILHDKKGNTWIGTYFGGINIVLSSSELFNIIEPGISDFDLKGKAVRRLVEINDDLWIATEDGGLNVYNKETNKISSLPQFGNNVHELLYDSLTNELWVGTFLSGLYNYNIETKKTQRFRANINNGLESDAIFSLVKDSNQTLWIGSTIGLRYYDKTSNTFKTINNRLLSSEFIYTMLIDKENNLWLGTVNLGLFKYNITSGEITHLQSNENNPTLLDNYITYLYQDKKGVIWIGTNNKGLHQLDPENNRITHLEISNYNNDKSICGILEDDNHKLWVSTHAGLICLNKERNSVTKYTTDEGLPINQFNYSSCLRSNNGQFYFGSIYGLIGFYPNKLALPKEELKVNLVNLFIDNKVVLANSTNSPLTTSLNQTKQIELTYAQSKNFYIDYSAILPGHTSTINYAVKLIGRDNNWINVGNQRRIVCSNIPNGKYTLMVRANNSSINWDDAPITQIEIIINPPFYRSNYAFILYFLFLIGLSYIVIKISSSRLQQKNLIRIALMEKEKLKEINKIKIDFFTSISHELKTPLSLIVAPLKSIISNTNLTGDIKKRLQLAHRNAIKMVSLIDELTTFNKIENGLLRLHLVNGNPLHFIKNQVELYYENIYAKELTLTLNIEDHGEEVWFSPSHLEKIVNNLLSNAIKFTPQGKEIRISSSLTDNLEGDIFLKLKIEDSGIGIPQNELSHIFDEYYQIKSENSEDFNGWGIGLSLTKKLVKLHKGKIEVSSELNVGSEFGLEINVTKSAFENDELVTIEKEESFLKNYRYSEIALPVDKRNLDKQKIESIKVNKQVILIVDDNKELVNFTADLFSDKYRILTADNGLNALNIIQKDVPDLIISDVMMPQMNGYEFCKRIKNDILTSHIPVFLLTAKNDQQNHIEGFQCGANAYITKPFDPNELALQVNNMLELKHQQQKEMQDFIYSNKEMESISNPDNEFILKLNELIDDNIDNTLFQVSDITSKLGISRTVLHVKMKNLLDLPISEYIRKKRLHYAKRLLSAGINIAETSFKCGFSSPSYFSKCFKTEFDISPSDFLKTEKPM